MQNMSFREKGAWAYLITTLVVFVPYFVSIFSRLLQGSQDVSFVLGAFIGATIFCTVLSIVFGIIVQVSSREEPYDERDLIVDAKANRNAYYVLLTLCFMAMGCVLFIPVFFASLPTNPFVMLVFASQVFFLCFVVAEIIKYTTQVIFYRQGV
jgi:hypothetical protein